MMACCQGHTWPGLGNAGWHLQAMPRRQCPEGIVIVNVVFGALPFGHCPERNTNVTTQSRYGNSEGLPVWLQHHLMGCVACRCRATQICSLSSPPVSSAFHIQCADCVAVNSRTEHLPRPSACSALLGGYALRFISVIAQQFMHM